MRNLRKQQKRRELRQKQGYARAGLGVEHIVHAQSKVAEFRGKIRENTIEQRKKLREKHALARSLDLQSGNRKNNGQGLTINTQL